MVGRPRTNLKILRPDDLLTREQAREVARFMVKRDNVPPVIPGISSDDPACDMQRLQRRARLLAFRILSEREARTRPRVEPARAAE